jgi:hypothetical protein
MQKIKLSDFRNALKYGYLPTDWKQRAQQNCENFIRLDSGYIALSQDTIETACGCVYHHDIDSDEFSWDELDDCYIESENAAHAYGKRGNQIFTHEDNCIEYRGDWFVSQYLSDNDIMILHNGDYCHSDYCHYIQDEGEYYESGDCFYWDSDGEYHLTEEEQINTLYGYGAGPREKCFLFEDSDSSRSAQFGWGIEIEKNEMPDFDFDKKELYDNTGAVIEEDSSVSDGFELKTPIYNLYSPKTLERLAVLRDFCNVKNVRNAGGHIGFSMEGKNDEQLLDLCRGFLPLIYAMHKKRLHCDYCTPKKIDDLKADGSKYQSIRLRGNYIEFRIFGAVRTFDTILFRLDLFRIMADNLGANFSKVLIMAINVNHPLNKLLMRVYGKRVKFERLINDAVEIDRNFGTGRISQKTITKILDRIQKTFVDTPAVINPDILLGNGTGIVYDNI